MQALIVFGLVAFAAAQTAYPTVPISEFDCSTEPSVDYFYPDPNGDCQTFYRCVPNMVYAYRYTCESGQVFYEPTQRCEYESAVPPPCGTDTSSGNTGGGSSGFSCAGIPDGKYEAAPCSAGYYNCDPDVGDGEAPIQYCQNGLVFNEAAGYCDYSYNVAACGISTSTIITNVVTQGPSFSCAGKPAGYYPDPDCCFNFYTCDAIVGDGDAPVQSCGNGLVFNDATDICDYPYNVPGCEDSHCN